jgi:hypothetical protein
MNFTSKKVVSALLLIAACTSSFAQKGKSATITIGPYLQDATPSTAKIMWETSSGDQSLVEWGTTQKLGKKTAGIAYDVNYTDARVHEVNFVGLHVGHSESLPGRIGGD